MLRNRFLGGVSPFVFYAAEDGAGTAGGDAGGGGAAAAAAAAAGAAAAAAAAAGTGADQGAGGAAAGADKTLAGGGDAGAALAAAAAATPGKLPDNWREQLAGEDKQALKDLAKYTDPNAIYKSLRTLQADISSGKLKAPPPPLAADATPEQKAEWRATNGLPDKAEAYVEKIALPDGLVIGEAEKPLVGEFAKMALDKGWNQSQFNEALGFYFQAEATAQAQQATDDHQGRVAAEVALKGEWGARDYAPNMAAMNSVLQLMPEDVRVGILAARGPDGRMLGDSPGFIKALASLGRELNPAATIIPSAGSDGAQTVTNQIAEIEKSMYLKDGTPNPGYWKGAAGEAQQARYRELVDVQQRMAAKGKAA